MASRGATRGRVVWGGAAVGLAVLVTVAVVLTDDPVYLRVLLLAVCWAAVAAGLLLGNRGGGPGTADPAAADREAELRHAYELELAREVAARHEHEAELEGRLRREAEQAMRAELAQLRGELAGLTGVREELAAVSRLSADLSALEQLRSEVAALGSLRAELSGLGQVRTELAALGELRADLGRMRAELTEQLSGELLIERMVMRAQSVRGPAAGLPEQRSLDGESSGWPSMGPASSSWDTRFPTTVDAEPVRRALPDVPPAPMPTPPPPPPAVRAERDVAPPPSPREWLSAQSLVDQPAAPAPRRHRRAAEPDDDALAAGRHGRDAADAESWSAPAWLTGRSAAPGDEPDAGATAGPILDPELSRDPELSSWASGPYGTGELSGSWWQDGEPTPAAPEAPATSGHWSPAASDTPGPRPTPEPQGHARLEQILAESGVPAPSGRRRRRYRDEEDAGDDVLARVLRGE
ncbi:DUF6779 domain-containing protein [Modestobacter sp. SYSU DS0290]